MEKKDLDQIRGVVKEEVAQGFHQAFANVWGHNLEPAFNHIQNRVDNVSNKLLEHDARLEKIEENMADKSDISRVTTSLDKVTTILERLDKERVSITEWIKRIENDVKQLS